MAWRWTSRATPSCGWSCTAAPLVSPDGVETYTGPTDFTPDFPKLEELALAGDFEAVSSWYIGMSETSCVRVLTLQGPSRLVIDIEH